MELVQGLDQNLQNMGSQIANINARMDKQDKLNGEVLVKMKSYDALLPQKHINRTLKSNNKVDCKYDINPLNINAVLQNIS